MPGLAGLPGDRTAGVFEQGRTDIGVGAGGAEGPIQSGGEGAVASVPVQPDGGYLETGGPYPAADVHGDAIDSMDAPTVDQTHLIPPVSDQQASTGFESFAVPEPPTGSEPPEMYEVPTPGAMTPTDMPLEGDAAFGVVGEKAADIPEMDAENPPVAPELHAVEEESSPEAEVDKKVEGIYTRAVAVAREASRDINRNPMNDEAIAILAVSIVDKLNNN